MKFNIIILIDFEKKNLIKFTFSEKIFQNKIKQKIFKPWFNLI